jgi:acetylornithine deacetylase
MDALTEHERRLLAMIDERENRLVELIGTLIGFPTTNPPGSNEAEAQAWMAERMAAVGMDVETFDALPGRPNVIGRLTGRSGGRSLLFNGHIDVAELRTPEAWTYPPFEGTVAGRRIYGLGSSDMKSSHAGVLLALECLYELGYGLGGDMVYESVIGEEAGEPGTRSCVERGISADFAIVGECSKAEDVFVSSVGIMNARITLSDPVTRHLIQRRRMLRAGGGLNAANAIEKMATKIIPALLELEQEWGVFKSHPMLPEGQALINVFSIDGGGNTFILPNECRAFVTVVYLPGEETSAVQQNVEAKLNAVAAADSWLSVHPPTVEWNPEEFPVVFLPIDGSPDDEGASLLADCLGEICGRNVVVSGRDAIMDGGWLYQAGIPSVVFGPGDKRVIHQPDEHVEIDDALTYTKTLALFLARWCGLEASSP